MKQKYYIIEGKYVFSSLKQVWEYLRKFQNYDLSYKSFYVKIGKPLKSGLNKIHYSYQQKQSRVYEGYTDIEIHVTKMNYPIGSGFDSDSGKLL